MISVVKAEHINGLKLTCFSDNTEKQVNFEPFLTAKEHSVFKFYSKIKNFKKINIDNGKLVWGKDWDLIFPTAQLYKGNILN